MEAESMKEMSLVIATPFYEMKGWSPYISSLVRTMELLNQLGIKHDFWALQEDSYVDRARNTLAMRFLDSDFTHMMFIDSDESWSLEGFANVLKADVEIVGAGYPCKNKWDFYSCILNCHEDGRPIVNKDGLVSAWGVPTGFMKIHRKAFERVIKAMPDNFYETNDPDTGEVFKVYNFFGRIPPMGEDISFCRRFVASGGELWVEPRVDITHYGTIGHSGNYHQFLLECPGGSLDKSRVKSPLKCPKCREEMYEEVIDNKGNVVSSKLVCPEGCVE